MTIPIYRPTNIVYIKNVVIYDSYIYDPIKINIETNFTLQDVTTVKFIVHV